MRKVFTIALLTLALVSGLEAQTPAVAPALALSPVPLWPRDGDTSQLPKGQYVFYDPPAAEYVVYYAGNSAGVPSAQPTILRFGSHALVDPDVTLAVASNSDGSFHYTYSVANGSRARQPIQEIGVFVFYDRSPRGSHPTWTAKVVPQNFRDLATPGTSQASIEWTTNAAARAIAPGSAVPGFAIDSTSLPGFVTIVFQGESQSNQYTPDAVASLPQEVRDQLARVFERDVKGGLVIGPRFSKGTSQSTITQNFVYGIQVLIRSRKLDSKSPFVENAKRVLTAQLLSQDQMQLNSASLAFTKDAKTDVEKEIANALEVAFAQ